VEVLDEVAMMMCDHPKQGVALTDDITRSQHKGVEG